jgi:heme/copper-type cytochrome/quinol oxidase subunit 2
VYVVVAAGIFGGIFGTLFGLFIFHRKQRDQERERRVQYWREQVRFLWNITPVWCLMGCGQNAFHQSLLQMRQTARASILSLPGNGNSGHNSMYADEQPILQHAAPKGSGLRHYVGDDSSEYDEGMMQHTKQHDNRF